jgi:hypothetical protein
LSTHPDWTLGTFLSQENSLAICEKRVLVILIGRELGQLERVDYACTAEGLSRCVSLESHQETVGDIFRPDANLVRLGLIQPCEGRSALISSGDDELSEIQFELTQASLDTLKLKRRASRCPKHDSSNLRMGRLNLSQLVLSDSVHSALQMALSQVRHRGVLMDQWGLANVFPYGRGVTVLLSGPPGTGKTAISEALAKELGQPLLVAGYARIQNCFVGQTEKNISRTFNEARLNKAVLFWDEADAMFFDRDSASHTWEVRDINVLLQELEKFDGVCLLATNRKVTLDKALERRISLKIEVERPNRDMRLKLWHRLVPASLPLAPDVCLNALAAADLSGGEIKNVILNAARMTLCRNPNDQVTMADFERAIELELKGMWSEIRQGPVGFTPKHI